MLIKATKRAADVKRSGLIQTFGLDSEQAIKFKAGETIEVEPKVGEGLNWVGIAEIVKPPKPKKTKETPTEIEGSDINGSGH